MLANQKKKSSLILEAESVLKKILIMRGIELRIKMPSYGSGNVVISFLIFLLFLEYDLVHWYELKNIFFISDIRQLY